MLPEVIVYWHWLAFGAALAAIEILAPGVVFLWLGVAAAATGLILLIFPSLPWTIQLLLFAALSVAAVYLGRRLFRPRPDAEEARPGLNRRGHRLVGQRFTLTESTVDGRGRLQVGDGWWRIVSLEGEMAAGTTIEVTAVEGTTLKVNRAGD